MLQLGVLDSGPSFSEAQKGSTTLFAIFCMKVFASAMPSKEGAWWSAQR